MSDAQTYHSSYPSLLPLYARAIRTGRSPHGQTVDLPTLSASTLGAPTRTPNLARYRKVCGFDPSRHLPITWPHIMAFPLQMKVLTEREFPLPLLGLVHLRNTITQHRAIGAGEPLDLHVRLGEQTRTNRGIEFELLTNAVACGETVWEESSVLLYRMSGKGNSGSSKASAPPALPDYPNRRQIDAPGDTGRQYARVSGDSNPIHLYAVTAKAFGFPRPIAHGMWSMARVLSTLQTQKDWRDGPMRVSCDFKKPLFLPGQAQLAWQTDGARWPFQLLNEKGDAPHLSGSIEWL